MAIYRASEFAKWAAEQFNWNIVPELVQLDVNSMPEDRNFEAQRNLDTELASQLAQHYLPAVAAGVIVAELPDGRRVFVDGQHRWKAAKDAGHKTIWALLFRMSEAQAAAFFDLKNGQAVRLTSHMDSTLSRAEAGHDPTKTLISILDKHGCFLDRTRRRLQGAVGTSKMVQSIYAVDEGKLLDQTLDVITDCWGRGVVALSAEVLEGMALFLAHWSESIDTQRQREMRQRFHDEDLDLLVQEALRQWKQYRSTNNKATYIEAQLMFVFNHKRSSVGHRLPERTAGQLAKMASLKRLAQTSRPKQAALV